MISEAYLNRAKKVPPEIRDRYLLHDGDPLQNAITSGNDPYMRKIADIWFNFIDTTAERDYNCPRCMANILHNMRELKESFIYLQKQSILLNNL